MVVYFKAQLLLSLYLGNFELVYVTHLKDPSDFKVQRYADKDRLQVMMTALNNYCKRANTTEDLVYKVEEGLKFSFLLNLVIYLDFLTAAREGFLFIHTFIFVSNNTKQERLDMCRYL